MTQAIGFAGIFYTLWTIDSRERYTTDVNGKHWLTGYDVIHTYHKNISKDLDKAVSLYPNLSVCEDLRGKTTSWTSKSKEDLCPNIMKFGKHCGEDINDLIKTDFSYLVWMCENKGYSSNGKYAKELPEIKSHFQAVEDAENKLIADRNNAFKSLLDAGVIEFTASRNLSVDSQNGVAYACIDVEGVNVSFKFEQGAFSSNYYNGFTYGLPIVKGKSKRMKGKAVRFEFVEDVNEVFQVTVTNVSILANQPA
jgi:hypothetical protein